MSDNIVELIAMIELENRTTGELKKFDIGVKQVTFSEITRALRREQPELIKQLEHFIKLKYQNEEANQDIDD